MQNRTKKRYNKLQNVLQEQKTFAQILEETKFPNAWLHKMLQSLVEEGKINKIKNKCSKCCRETYIYKWNLNYES